MPLKVPGESGSVVPLAKPSEVDLMMALATMHQLGRVPTFDERFRGQDPTSLPISVFATGRPVRGIPKGTKGISPDLSFEPESMPKARTPADSEPR